MKKQWIPFLSTNYHRKNLQKVISKQIINRYTFKKNLNTLKGAKFYLKKSLANKYINYFGNLSQKSFFALKKQKKTHHYKIPKRLKSTFLYFKRSLKPVNENVKLQMSF